MRRVLGGVAGFVIGGVLAAAGWWLGGASATAADAPDVAGTTTTTTVVPDQPYFDPSEVALGSSVLIPTEIAVNGTEAVLSFRMVDMAPPTLGADVDFDTRPSFQQPGGLLDYNLVAPIEWTLTTTSGEEIRGTTANVRAATARFTVPEGFTSDDIAGIRLDLYRQRIPMNFDVDFTPEDRSRQVLDDTASIELQSVVEQATGSVYRFTVDHDRSAFISTGAFVGDDIVLWGRGPGWISFGINEDSFQLTHESPAPLEVIPVRVVSNAWHDISRPVEIPIAGLEAG